MIFVGVVYPVWFFFYCYHTRNGSSTYADFYQNIRITILFAILVDVFYVFFCSAPGDTATMFLLQITVLFVSVMYCIDISIPICYSVYKESVYVEDENDRKLSERRNQLQREESDREI
eukprot:Pgem_evm2s5532